MNKLHLRNHIRSFILWIINHFMAGNYLWFLKSFLLKLTGVKIGKNVKIVGPLFIDVCIDLTIGDNTWVGKNLTILGNANVNIGENCDIAPYVCLETGTHEIGTSERRAGKGYCESISIEKGCWIGIRATILPGVSIGSGAIVAAGAVVNKNVESNIIAGGIPAKKLKEC